MNQQRVWDPFDDRGPNTVFHGFEVLPQIGYCRYHTKIQNNTLTLLLYKFWCFKYFMSLRYCVFFSDDKSVQKVLTKTYKVVK